VKNVKKRLKHLVVDFSVSYVKDGFTSCVNVSKECYEALKVVPGYHWFCDICDIKSAVSLKAC